MASVVYFFGNGNPAKKLTRMSHQSGGVLIDAIDFIFPANTDTEVILRAYPKGAAKVTSVSVGLRVLNSGSAPTAPTGGVTPSATANYLEARFNLGNNGETPGQVHELIVTVTDTDAPAGVAHSNICYFVQATTTTTTTPPPTTTTSTSGGGFGHPMPGKPSARRTATTTPPGRRSTTTTRPGAKPAKKPKGKGRK